MSSSVVSHPLGAATVCLSDRSTPSFTEGLRMLRTTAAKQIWTDRDGRQRTDNWHPARKSDGLLPLLSLTMCVPGGRGTSRLVEEKAENLDHKIAREPGVATQEDEEGFPVEGTNFDSHSLPPLSGFPQATEAASTDPNEDFSSLPSIYFVADDEGREGGDKRLPLITLKDHPDAMQQFLEFRQEEKRRRIGAIEQDFGERSAQMMREVFCPPTPDFAVKQRSKHKDMPPTVISVMSHEYLLYEHFKKYSHLQSADSQDSAPIRSTSQDEFGGWQEGSIEQVEKVAMDLRGYIAFMRDFGLIPRQVVHEGTKSALPIQYSLAVQAFKLRQGEIRSADVFGFPDFKDSLYKFFSVGSQGLQEQIDDRLQKIAKLEIKIARQVPNSFDAVQALKDFFSQLFDSIFDAYIYFDHAGDWQVTMSGFRQQCKKLSLPLTEADLYSALLNKTKMSFLDQFTFINTFGWYPLLVKPKIMVDTYKVQPAEASLHRMFCLSCEGVRAEDALAEVKRVEEEARKRESLAALEPRRRPSETEMVTPRLVADNRNFVGGWRKGDASSRSLDGARSPVSVGDVSPSRLRPGPTGRMLLPDSRTPSPPGTRRGRSPDSTSPPVKRRLSTDRAGTGSPRSAKAAPSGAPGHKLSSCFDEGGDAVSPLPEDGADAGPVSPEAEPKTEFDSADHAMPFQAFVDVLKALSLVPIAEAEKTQDKEGEAGKKEAEAGNKTDLGSAEFETALEMFRETIGKGDRLEWQEFKDCLYSFLRTGLRRLNARCVEVDTELFRMRVRMSKFAPSSDNPLAAFKEVLAVRFDNIYDAFVYFDNSGDWQLTKAEMKNMMRRLLSPLTSVDVDAALNQVFLTSGHALTALDFVRKLKWTKELPKKVLEDYTISAEEKDIHDEFVQFSRKGHDDPSKGDAEQPQRELSSKSLGLSRSGSGGTDGEEEHHDGDDAEPSTSKKRLSKEEIAQKKQEAETRLAQDDFVNLAIYTGIVKLKDTAQMELVQRVFQMVNWAEDKDNEISWPEFKHVLYLYFQSGPTLLQPTLDAKRQELRMKRLELYQRVKTQTDSVKAMRESLAERFDSVFDAFCYFDVASDDHVSVNDMKNMLPRLRMAMTVADLHAAIMKIMKVKDLKTDIFVDPMDFCKSLAWHPKPKAGPGLRRALDAAKARRNHIAEKAHTKAEAAPAPIPTDPTTLPDDAQVVDRLQKQIDELLNLQKQLRDKTDVLGMQIDSSLALPDAEVTRRKELAQQDLRDRALKASDRGITELLERAAKNKMRIQETAQQRSQDNDYARKMLGLKDGAREPPKVETLLQWAPKTEKLDLRLQQEKLTRVNEAIQRLSQVKEVLGVPIKDLAISTKDRFRKQEIGVHNREVKRIAVQGVHTMVLDGLEKAKLRRKEIVALARKRSEKLRKEWAKAPFPSETVRQALEWFSEMAKKRLEQEKRVHSMPAQNTEPSKAKGSSSPHPAKKPGPHNHHHGKAVVGRRDRGPMNPDRIKASVSPMSKALKHRFANIYDAWAYFDAEGSWEVSKSEFRKRSQGIRLSEDHVDVEAVLRAVNGDGSEKVNPHDFVRVLKWHEMPSALADLRGAFDVAAKRRAVVSDVAMRRSKMSDESREHSLSAEDEVATEEQRAHMERMKAKEGLKAKRQRRLKEMAGPPRLFVDWAVPQDLTDLQQLYFELEQHRDVLAQVQDAAAHDIKGLAVEELSFKYHTLAVDLYAIDPQERVQAANAIKQALRQHRKLQDSPIASSPIAVSPGDTLSSSRGQQAASLRGTSSAAVGESSAATSRDLNVASVRRVGSTHAS